MTEEEAAKALERQRKKEEKKEARKEGRAKAKQAKANAVEGAPESICVPPQSESASLVQQPQRSEPKGEQDLVGRPSTAPGSRSTKPSKAEKNDQMEIPKKEGAKKQTR